MLCDVYDLQKCHLKFSREVHCKLINLVEACFFSRSDSNLSGNQIKYMLLWKTSMESLIFTKALQGTYSQIHSISILIDRTMEYKSSNLKAPHY